uniref:KASH domain-containing protein n=1 Tax=Xiphophorus couchianus TaxID=32473 RepID=A0A3B5L7N4_9TELE
MATSLMLSRKDLNLSYKATMTGLLMCKLLLIGGIECWELQQTRKPTAETKVKCHDLEHWHKLNSDLCDVTSWLGRVLPELERLQHIAPSPSIQDIEVNIKKLKEMRRTFNTYKCLMISANLSSHYFLQADDAELQELQEALCSTNHSWTQACSTLQSWERKLHSALMQCQEFHEALHSLLLLLSQAENKLHAVNIFKLSIPPQDFTVLCHPLLQTLQEELHSRHRQVSALQEISSQLLLEATSEESVEAKEKIHVIGNKLHVLLQKVAAALCSLQEIVVGSCLFSGQTCLSLSACRGERRDLSLHRPLLCWIIRAVFSLHMLFLVLLVLVFLVPLSDQDHSCSLSNNFARSFYPMLHYTNGPPPT